MNKKAKQFVKNIPIVKILIKTLIHPSLKTKKIDKEIKKVFNNLDSSLEDFYKTEIIPNLIISLTSFPTRIKFIEYTIFSLIQQNIRPEKIFLWLSETEFPNKENNIPDNIKRYHQFGLEIKFIKENHRSYKKLVYSLKEYPKHVIVTADDDVYYKPEWLKLLFSMHKLFPKNIISHYTRRVSFNNKKLKPYLTWKHNAYDVSFINFSVGLGGILYPPDCLYKDVTDSSLYLKLCPHADDIWFYVMALLAGTKIRKVKSFRRKVYPLDYQYTNEWKDIPSLMDVNWNENKNDAQLKAVLKHYSIYKDFYDKYA